MEPTTTDNLPEKLNGIKMRFRPNILGYASRSPWIGSYNGLVVFPDQNLSRKIEECNLVNKLIIVDLEIRSNPHNDKCRYEASNLCGEVAATEDLAWQEISGCLGPYRQRSGRQTIILIDGQNVISCYKKAIYDNKPTLAGLIETIISGTYRVASARLYLCEDELGNGNDSEVKSLQTNQQIEIVSEPVKKIQNNGYYGSQPSIIIKRNIDSIIIADAMEAACLGKNELQCLALFSGDSDYADVLRRWLRLRPNGVVHIFAFANSVAKELMELGNCSRVMVFFLDQQLAALSGD